MSNPIFNFLNELVQGSERYISEEVAKLSFQLGKDPRFESYLIGKGVTEEELREIRKATSVEEIRKSTQVSGVFNREQLLGTSGQIDQMAMQSVSPDLIRGYSSAQAAGLYNNLPVEDVFTTIRAGYNVIESDGGFTDGWFAQDGVFPSTNAPSNTPYQEVMRILYDYKAIGAIAEGDAIIFGDTLSLNEKLSIDNVIRKSSTAYANATGLRSISFRSVFEQHSGSTNGTNGSQGTPFSQWGGTLQSYVTSGFYKNKNGEALNYNDINEAANTICEGGFANPNNLKVYGPMGVFAAYNRESLPVSQNRVVLGQTPQMVTNGAIALSQITTFGGVAEFIYDNLMKRCDPFGKSELSTATSGAFANVARGTNPPGNPTLGTGVSGGAIGVVADAVANFGSQAGSYFFAVAAGNDTGISQIVPINTTALAVANNQAVDISIVAGSGTTSYYVLYRSEKVTAGSSLTTNTRFFPVAILSAANLAAGYDGGAPNILRDRCRKIANTQTVFMVDNSLDTISIAQRRNMRGITRLIVPKGTNGIMGTSIIHLNLATPLVKFPKRMYVFENVAGSRSYSDQNQ